MLPREFIRVPVLLCLEGVESFLGVFCSKE